MASEQMIYARGKWEFARIELNRETGKRQWIRRDTSYICDVGQEKGRQPVPPAPR